jgi:hypothetical protein
MKKALSVWIAVILVGGALVPAAMAADTLVRFKGGIGVIPVSSGVAIVVGGVTQATSDVVNRNVVRGVQPAGQIWVISDLRADVKVDGRIRVDGRGLLLGGGDNVGGNANAKVFATLMCPNDDNRQHSSDLAGVALEPNGDFRIDDVLGDQPLPTSCADPGEVPVLLIRNAANKAWFAAGIPER